MNSKMLSVIVPIYNTEKYIRECIDSIINQTYKNLDIILVDDGSTDSSGEIADEYREDSRVRVIHKNNRGPIKARLDGVKAAKGDFVTFVDADDWIDKNMYSCMMQKVNNNQIDMILCGMNGFYENGESHNKVLILQEGLYEEQDLVEKVYPRMIWDNQKGINGVDDSLCSKIIRKNILLDNLSKASGLDIHLGEDAAVAFPAMLEIKSLFITHDIFYHHRQRAKGIAAPYVKDSLFFDNLFVLYKYLKERLKEQSCYVEFQEQLDLFIMKFIPLRRRYLESIEEKPEVIFPFDEVNKNSRVVMYGAGNNGKEYIRQNEKFHFCQVVLWVDKNYTQYTSNLKISNPNEIKNTTYDFIIIAVQAVGLADEIRRELLSLGVSEEKIIWKTMYTKCFLD